MKERFIQFLKDNGALEKFEANLSLDNVNDETPSRYWISDTFIWPEEEDAFWDNLNDKWESQFI